MDANVMQSSWILTVGLGCAILALSMNTIYPTAKAKEQQKQLSEKAWQLLLPEILDNLDVASTYNQVITKNRVPPKNFRVSAWEMVSGGGMLLGLEPNDLNSALRAYSLLFQANALYSRMLDLDTRSQTVGNPIIYRDDLLHQLVDTVKSAEIALKDLDSRSGS
jgi:hypothetical protein